MNISIGLKLCRPWLQADPLAGIPFAARLQAHNNVISNVTPTGTGAPGGTQFMRPLGLYTDAGMTVPAVTWGDQIYNWRDELSASGVVATQSVSTQRPVLQWGRGADGVWVPFLVGDGVDDLMTGPLLAAGAGNAFTIIVTYKATSLNSTYQVIASNGNTGSASQTAVIDPSNNRRFYTNPNDSVDGAATTSWETMQISWDGTTRKILIDGVPQSITNSTSSVGPGNTLFSLFNDPYNSVFGGGISSFFYAPLALTLTPTQQAYIQSLRPA